MIELGQWTPDQPDYQTGVSLAKNVQPAARGYRPVARPADLSNAADNYIRGITSTQDNDLNFDLFAGDETKLYRYDSTNSNLVDVSKSGGYSTTTEQRWRFTQFGQRLVATNLSDNIQSMADPSSGTFGDLVSFSAKYLGVVNNFLVVAHTNDATDGEVPYRVRWSAINDATDFTVSTTTQSDFQDIVDGRRVTGFVGGEEGMVLMDNQIVRMVYVGSPLVFQFDTIDQQRGCAFPGSVANVGRRVYFISDDGFYVTQGAGAQPIGAERVNRWFFDRLNRAFSYRIFAAADPINELIAWAFPSSGADNGTPDTIIIYNYAVDKWSYLETEVEAIAPLFTSGYTLDELDQVSSSIDALPASLDSSQWAGGQLFLGGAKDNKLVSFSGTNLPATVETPEFEVQETRHGLMTEVHPYIKGDASVTTQVASRIVQSDTPTFGAASSINAANFCPVRSRGRFHRIRLNLTGDTWEYVYGASHRTRATGRR